jgi:hypothetical protein
MKVERRPVSPIRNFPSPELPLFTVRGPFDIARRDPQLLNHARIQHTDSSGGNRSHRQLFVPRNPELSDEEDVERSVQCQRDLERDRHPTTRKSQHSDVVPTGVGRELRAEGAACLASIKEGHEHTEIVSSIDGPRMMRLDLGERPAPHEDSRRVN